MKAFVSAAIAAACISFNTCAADPAPDKVLAKRGDVEVTTRDFMAFIARLNPGQQAMLRANLDQISGAVSSIFVTRTLAKEAEQEGLDKDPEVARRMELAREQILSQIYIDRFEKNVKLPDFDAKAREIYKSDPDRFTRKASMKAEYIVVTTQGRTDEEARRRAEEARAKLLDGKPFEAVAREYTNDASFRANDGVYEGPIDLVHPDLAKVARTIPLNQVSPVIHTSDGYNVIRVTERLPASVVPFEKVKTTLVEDERSKARKAAVAAKLASITQSKDVVLYTDDIAALHVDIDRKALSELHEQASKRIAEAKKKALEEEAAQEAADKAAAAKPAATR